MGHTRGNFTFLRTKERKWKALEDECFAFRFCVSVASDNKQLAGD